MEASCGVSTWEEHTGERKWEVLGRRGHSKAIFALAVQAWHRTVHRIVNYRLDGRLRSPKYTRKPYFKERQSVLFVPYCLTVLALAWKGCNVWQDE